MNILFVCTGNISRSFLAEMLLKNEIESLELDNISTSSAGMFAYPGNPPDSEMVEYLTKMGIPIKDHESRQIAKEDVEWADNILVMEKEHTRMIEKLWPEAEAKVELLGNYISDGQDADDIVDPFGRTPYHYRLAQSQITLAVRSLVKNFLPSRTNNQNV